MALCKKSLVFSSCANVQYLKRITDQSAQNAHLVLCWPAANKTVLTSMMSGFD